MYPWLCWNSRLRRHDSCFQRMYDLVEKQNLSVLLILSCYVSLPLQFAKKKKKISWFYSSRVRIVQPFLLYSPEFAVVVTRHLTLWCFGSFSVLEISNDHCRLITPQLIRSWKKRRPYFLCLCDLSCPFCTWNSCLSTIFITLILL